MRLIKFTYNKKEVWVNPEQVVAVHPSATIEGTDICCTKWIFPVEESVSEVISLLLQLPRKRVRILWWIR